MLDRGKQNNQYDRKPRPAKNLFMRINVMLMVNMGNLAHKTDTVMILLIAYTYM